MEEIAKGDINIMDKMNHGPVKRQLKYCVGIGASAGGVEALQELFRNMPLDTDASFIVVQHLYPDSVSMIRTGIHVYISSPG